MYAWGCMMVPQKLLRITWWIYSTVAAWIINRLEFVCLWFPSWSSYKQLDVKHIMIYFDYIAHQTHLFKVLNESTVFLFNIKKKTVQDTSKLVVIHIRIYFNYSQTTLLKAFNKLIIKSCLFSPCANPRFEGFFFCWERERERMKPWIIYL